MTTCADCGEDIGEKQHSSRAYEEDGGDGYLCIECWHDHN